MQQHAMYAHHPESPVMPAVTMTGITDQVMEDMLEMPPYLPKPAGIWRAHHQGIARAFMLRRSHFDLGSRQPFEFGDCRFFFRLSRAAIKIVIDREGFIGPTTTNGEVAFLDIAGHELLAECRCTRIIEGYQQTTAGRAIESMDKKNLAAELFAQSIMKKIIFTTRQGTRVRHQTGRLVHYRDVFIAVEHFDKWLCFRNFAHARLNQAANMAAIPAPSATQVFRFKWKYTGDWVSNK